MELVVHLGFLDILVRSPLQDQIVRIQELFHPRTSDRGGGGVPLLTCDVVDDPEPFQSLVERLDFTGPSVDISPHVTAKYSLCEGQTYIKVKFTAIIELTDADPAYARVFLEPYSSSDDSKRPLPEAFFYPLVVEWLRNFNAYLVHCGAVSIHGKAVILTGPPGSGKSTHVMRMLMKGATFLADDLLIMKQEGNEIILLPFREVANLSADSVDRFRDMEFLRTSPKREDGKYQVSIADYFGQNAASRARPGFVLHLHKSQDRWISERSADKIMGGLFHMAFFMSRKEQSAANFFTLAELMTASCHLDVSQGYFAERLDELMAYLTEHLQQVRAHPSTVSDDGPSD